MSLAQKLRQEGRQEGRHEGRQEGWIAALRENVIEALKLRFEDVPVGLVEEVHTIDTEEKLRNLLRLAIRCASINEFAAKL